MIRILGSTTFIKKCKNGIKAGSILLFIAGMASCASVAPPSTPTTSTPWKDRQTQLNHLQNWQVNGKIAAQTAHDAGSASVNWVQNQNHYNISLLGPLGSSGMTLVGQPGQVTLQTPAGKRITATSPEQLLAQQWGFNVPVSNLNYWIRGLPVPDAKAETSFDAYGRLNSLTQQGWNVQFLSYTNAHGLELPSKITITSSALKVKIIIYQWRVS